MATKDDPSAKENPIAAAGAATGSNQGQYAGNRNVSTGDAPINDYGGVHGNVINNYFGSGAGSSGNPGGDATSSSGTPQPAGEQPGGSATPAPLNIIGLNELMKRNLDVQSMKEICTYIANQGAYTHDLSYDDLQGNGPGSKSLSLIDYCRRRRSLATLIDGINTLRPDILGANVAAWHNWAVSEDSRNI